MSSEPESEEVQSVGDDVTPVDEPPVVTPVIVEEDAEADTEDTTTT